MCDVRHIGREHSACNRNENVEPARAALIVIVSTISVSASAVQSKGSSHSADEYVRAWNYSGIGSGSEELNMSLVISQLPSA